MQGTENHRDIRAQRKGGTYGAWERATHVSATEEIRDVKQGKSLITRTSGPMIHSTGENSEGNKPAQTGREKGAEREAVIQKKKTWREKGSSCEREI